jgi:hypothetical protein
MQPQARWFFVAALVVAAALLVEARHLLFTGDEWDFIQALASPTVGFLFAPHNGHWSTLPIALYDALLHTIGLRTYVPYLGVLLFLHASCATLLYVLLRQRRDGWFPTWAACLLVVFGNGAENILWAFQVGFVGSVLFGLLAWVLIDRERPVDLAAAACLLLGVMSSGIGLVFATAIAVQLLAARQFRRLWVVVPAGLAFVAWFATVGHGGAGLPTGAVLASGTPQARAVALARFVANGISATAVSLVGGYHHLGDGPVAPVGAALVLAAVGLAAQRRWMGPRAWGGAAGLLFLFVLVGLVRSEFGPATASAGRYLYVGAVLGLVWCGSINPGWQPRGSLRGALGVIGALALVANLAILQADLLVRLAGARRQAAEISAVEALRGSPGADLRDPVDHALLDNLAAGPFYTAVDDFGSPVRGPGSSLTGLPPEAVDRVVRGMLGSAIHLGATIPAACPGAPRPDGASLPPGPGRAVVPAGGADLLAWAAERRDAWAVGHLSGPGLVEFSLPGDGRVRWHLATTGQGGAGLRICG